jgi:type I restriction enzyme M protein
MRKSLGEKRKEVSDSQIADIVRLYGNFDQQTSEEDEAQVKIFPNESFGFLRITVERPLRLRYEATNESADALASDDKLQAKITKATGDEATRDQLTERIRGSVGTTWQSDKEVRNEVKVWMADLGIKGKPIENAIVDLLSVKDADAPIVTDKQGDPEPDSDLRDNENVPLPQDPVRYEPDPSGRLANATYTQAVDAYVTAEVHPYVPDAWPDHTKTKIGYEIPLTRHFYVYTPPRPLEEIDAEIRQLEAEIQDLLAEVTE